MEWIDIKDDQPEETGEYIIAHGTPFGEPLYVESGGGWWDNDTKEFEDWEDNVIEDVTYWMPFPIAPRQ